MIEIEIPTIWLVLSRSSNYQHRILISIETSFDASGIPHRIDLWIVTGRWWCLNIFSASFVSPILIVIRWYSIINIFFWHCFIFLFLFFFRTIRFWILFSKTNVLYETYAKNLVTNNFSCSKKCFESKFDRTIIK